MNQKPKIKQTPFCAHSVFLPGSYMCKQLFVYSQDLLWVNLAGFSIDISFSMRMSIFSPVDEPNITHADDFQEFILNHKCFFFSFPECSQKLREKYLPTTPLSALNGWVKWNTKLYNVFPVSVNLLITNISTNLVTIHLSSVYHL